MDCIFCKIINKQAPSQIIYEDDEIIVFESIEPKAEFHFLFVPKKHIESIIKLQEKDILLIGKLLFVAKKVAAKNGLAKKGYKLVFNCGRGGGQIINHLHLHLLGGKGLRNII